ncbi:class I SAM-dependent methyltransferase [Pantanalinema sp. GBBB05]|uniref:class I SAM-dependent methyltransferase n=1 Tax=Pantanalinema sp. GBBB05 TaxID=2604139 RepID=UPI001DA4C31B|nr:class I SAM-dependent methyltransferase [Pantanalinema sp. GBBB05]
MKPLSPLTGSTQVVLLQTISSQQLIHDWQQQLQIDITSELKGYPEIYLYQCQQTGLKFFSPLDIAGSSHLYEALQQYPWYYLPDRWEHQVALKDLADCHTVLEIGCGSGDFVKSGLEAGLDIRGIELNQAAVLAAQNQGLPVEYLDLQDAAKLYHSSLDGVCSFQVLEHVPDPKHFIGLAIEMLKPGGKLILCVPNSDSIFQYHPNLLLDQPPHHLYRWSARSLKALEQLFPIQLATVRLEPLAAYHVPLYVECCTHRFSSQSQFWKLLFNRYTNTIYQTILNFGFRNHLTGMALYGQFHKLK